MKVSTLGFRWIPLSDNPSNIKGYYEYLIDGITLSELIDAAYGYKDFIARNFIGSIWQTGEPFDAINKSIFLGKNAAQIAFSDFDAYKTYLVNQEIPLYTCTCGDINCKSIIVKINTFDNLIEWNFGENEKIDPIYFDKTQYEDAIKKVFKF